MHDIMEGILQYEVQLMLKVMIQQEHYFTLDDLNSRITNFELGYMEEKDRPTVVSYSTLTSGHSLKQAGKSMCVYLCYIGKPFIQLRKCT